MRILVTGATGFIGSQITAELLQQGHQLTLAVRNVTRAETIFTNCHVVEVDFNTCLDVKDWLPKLNKIDIVINCIGVLQSTVNADILNIQYHAPKALFDACVKIGVKRIINISALGITQAHNEFARSKTALDEYLLSLPVSVIIVRPSLVYGVGSYGGTSLLRAMAALPGMIALPGDGQQAFQPIHIGDLAKAINSLLLLTDNTNKIIDAVGPKRETLRSILLYFRQWLGFKKTRVISIPLKFIRLICKFGDWFNIPSLNTTAYEMLTRNNVADNEATEAFFNTIDFKPVAFAQGLNRIPSFVQDRWHARLYFLRPLLRISIGFIWLYTGLVSAFFFPQESSYLLLMKLGINGIFLPITLYGAAIIDMILGGLTILNYRIKWVGLIQIAMILLYTILISIFMPILWLNPFAPIAKNIPLIIATLIMITLESDR